ncbi:MAG: outer membrane protein assembly factor BamD [Pseudomonadota bacterium]|nr:outer membrane protein assembly factor BamD [Pseudomonadota bacterium]
MFSYVIRLMLLLVVLGCSSNNKETSDTFSSDIELYKSGMSFLKKKEFTEAVEQFTELEIQHPYSKWATKGQLMAGFAHYKANEYEEAILTLSKFIELNPTHQSIPYAMYLKAYSYFERIPDVNLDQKLSNRAVEEFTELINKYPKSIYAKRSLTHLKTLSNHLAASEVKIAKFYQSQGYFLASIKRYTNVLKNYKKSSHIPESIFRLIECYISLGLVKQSYYFYKILEYNFPRSKWAEESEEIVKKTKINKNLKKFKKKQLDLKSLKPEDFDLI